MIGRYSIVRAATWRAIAASAGLFMAEPIGHVSAQEVYFDLTRALQDMAERSSRRHQLPPTEPDRSIWKSPDPGTGFVLSGVVIAGQTRLALLEDASASPGGPQLLPVGGELAGYRLTDIQMDQVTLERRDGQRVRVRLQTGGGVGGQPGPAAPPGRIDAVEPAKPWATEEERQVWTADQAAREKADLKDGSVPVREPNRAAQEKADLKEE